MSETCVEFVDFIVNSLIFVSSIFADLYFLVFLLFTKRLSSTTTSINMATTKTMDTARELAERSIVSSECTIPGATDTSSFLSGVSPFVIWSLVV